MNAHSILYLHLVLAIILSTRCSIDYNSISTSSIDYNPIYYWREQAQKYTSEQLYTTIRTVFRNYINSFAHYASRALGL